VPTLLHTSRTARTLFNVVNGAWVLGELRIRTTRPAYTGQVRRRTSVANRAVMVAGIGGGLFGAFTVAGHSSGPLIAGRSWPLLLFGLAVALAGIALRQWAVQALGRFFQLELVVQEQHSVVRSGPYRVLRHPSYAGSILTCIGIGIALGRWESLAFMFVLPTAAFVHRITMEERMLVAGVGNDYAQYRRETWRLLPGVW
jgi:protein-S-isoprenylcysteine O-methyltransferase Ste14